MRRREGQDLLEEARRGEAAQVPGGRKGESALARHVAAYVEGKVVEELEAGRVGTPGMPGMSVMDGDSRVYLPAARADFFKNVSAVHVC